MKKLHLSFILMISVQLLTGQIVDPFSIRFQTSDKGGIRYISNASLSCNSSQSGCTGARNEIPPNGTNNNNYFNSAYIDIDNDVSTFMSSSDSISLPNCSSILWAGLYWSALVAPTPAQYANRNQVKLKVNNQAYQSLTADEIQNNTVGYKTYHCFKNITAIVAAAGSQARYTVANVVTTSGGANQWGGWSIVIVYKNPLENMRNLTVFDGLANVNSNAAASTVDIPISGFLTPPSGPVNLELGVIAYDGDRGLTGDRLQFKGAASFQTISDATHGSNDLFNSTISYNGVLTPFRNPSYKNTLGYDASIFVPNNTTKNFIGNNATSATIRVTTGGETILTNVLTSAIDIYEPDLRGAITATDLNGAPLNSGDIIEYSVSVGNFGSDASLQSYMIDTLDIRTELVPGSIRITYGPNSGNKTEVAGDDQATYTAATRVLRVNIGTGANATVGGTIANSTTGTDSTVVKFQVRVTNDCMILTCDNLLTNKAYLYGKGNISGNLCDNNGLSERYDISGCPKIQNSQIQFNTVGCSPPVITSNGPICAGQNIQLNVNSSSLAVYSWTGPNGFTSSLQNPVIPNVQQIGQQVYNLHISFPYSTCTFDLSTTVTVKAAPTITLISKTNASCNGLQDGQIVTTASGTGVLTYAWSNGGNAATLSNIPAGSYTLTVTDQSCQAQQTYSITQPSPLLISESHVNVNCAGAATGSIDLTVSGGTAPYTYDWSNDGTGDFNDLQDITTLLAGNYSVTVKDALSNQSGCTASLSVQLSQPTALAVTTSKTDIACFGGSTGTISLNPTGGTAPYSYIWSNGATTQNLNNLAAGSYAVTIRDANGTTFGCQTTALVQLTQPTQIQLTSNKTDILCYGGATGSIDINITGGTAPYTCSWSSGEVSQDLMNKPAGSYTIQVTDANGNSNGCYATSTVALTQPNALVVTTQKTDLLCNGGNSGVIDLTVSGGTAPYSYLWSTGAVTQDLNQLTAGNYTVSIHDANGNTNGCSSSATVSLIEPVALLITTQQQDVLCHGAQTGAIQTTVTGGTSPYTYTWSNGSHTPNLTNLTSGVYTLSVHDANGNSGGCLASQTISISQPGAIQTSTNLTHVSCNGGVTGAIDLNVSGGTAPYVYNWSTGSNQQDLQGLVAGSYTYTIHDANGTTGGCSTTSTVIITEPTAIQVSHIKNDISCNGGNNGSIDLSVSGGTAPYTYSWSSGETSQDISNKMVGNYSVLIHDANGNSAGCSSTLQISLIEPNSIQIVSTVTPILCNTGHTGAIQLSASGGTAPYTYTWSSGQTTSSINSLGAGNYTVSIHDANGIAGGCLASKTVQLTEPPALSISYNKTAILCHGGNTGAIDISISGGTAPYSCSWSSGQTTQDLAGLSAGSYSLSLHDANGIGGGCAATETVLISEPDPLIVSLLNTDVACHGAQTGAIDLTVSGGTAPYSYLWSNGSTVADLSSLPAGNYNLTLHDANGNSGGCQAQASTTINQPEAVVITATKTDVLCQGASTGEINATISGGTAPYSYSWSNGSSVEDLSLLTAGSYTLHVHDSQGNQFGCASSKTIVINEPLPLIVSSSPTNLVCNGVPTGSISISLSGGTAPYHFNWSNGSTSQDLSSLAAGTYTLTVNDDNGNTFGCTATTTITIAEPNAVNIIENHANILCNGASTGEVDLTITGGTPPYLISWSNGAITEDINSLPAGSYTVSISDAAGGVGGCTASKQIILTEPTAVALALSQTDVVCHGAQTGAIDLSASGGTPPYTYNWSNGSAIQDPTNLAAGTYHVIVHDANGSVLGCVDTIETTIIQPTPLSLSETHTDVLCHSASTGAIDITPTGGTPPYTFSWSSGQSTEDVQQLAAGSFVVNVHDAAGTTFGCATQTQVVISQPTPISASATPTHVLCHGAQTGIIDLTINGGTSPYSYSWSNGSSLANANNLAAGSYTVAIHDTNGDTLGCKTTLSISITEPTSVALALSQTDVVCHGAQTGAIDLSASGGTPPYTYNWSNGSAIQDPTNLAAGTYHVIVHDANGSVFGCVDTIETTIIQPTPLSLSETHTDVLCHSASTGAIDITPTGGTPPYTFSWSDGQSTEDVQQLAAGSFVVNVHDAAGTTFGCATQTQVVISQPTPISASATPTHVLCHGAQTGIIDLTVNGGTSPYSYSWSNGSSLADINNLAAGSYTVAIHDAHGDTLGCKTTLSISITEPTAVTGNLTHVDIPCAGSHEGKIFTSIAGGTPPYYFSWSNGASTDSLNFLAPGVYTVTVHDQNGITNGCSLVLSDTIKEPNPVVIVAATATPVSCFGGSDGGIDLLVEGGTPPYFYQWDNGSQTEDLNGVPAANYGVTVHDSQGSNFGCKATISQLVDQPTTLVKAHQSSPIHCHGQQTGSIEIFISGGTSPYSYSWSTFAGAQLSSTTAILQQIPSDLYLVTSTDAHGCLIKDTIFVQEPDEIQGMFQVQDVICNGEINGSIETSIIGGTPGYTYAWVGPNGYQSINEDITQLGAGNYTLHLYDFMGNTAGCKLDTSFTIVDPPLFQSNITIFGNQPFCFGDSVVLTASPAMSYLWNTGEITQSIVVYNSGNYAVSEMSTTGCISNSPNEIINVFPIPEVDTGPNVDLCIGDSTQLNGTGAAILTWNLGLVNGNFFTPTRDTTLHLTGTSPYGCVNIDSVQLKVHLQPEISAGNDITLCAGDSVILSASGGVLYDWTPNIIDGVSFEPDTGSFQYIVKGVSSFGCIGYDTLQLIVKPLPSITLTSSEHAGCIPLTVTFKATAQEHLQQCNWIFNDGTTHAVCDSLTRTFDQPGCYDLSYLATSQTGCSQQVVMNNVVCVEAYPVASFYPDQPEISMLNPQVVFVNTSTGATTFNWDFGDNTFGNSIVNPTHVYLDEPKNYLISLIAFNSLGCSDTAYASVKVKEDLILYVPNSFTPNGDDHNNVFKPVFTYGFDPQQYKLIIFDRWGQLIFESHDASIGWNGTYGSNNEIDAVQDGTYTWKIEYVRSESNERKTVIGHVNVLK